MATYKRPRGTLDVLPEAAARWRRLESLIADHASSFGFGEIRTPVFEETEVFQRTSGASSDIVRKEMYTFQDRGGRSLTLRPEGTAPAARAYLENGLASTPQPVKLWYLGPIFRYDRPQAGRYRQHTQFGIEVFGAGSPLADVEVILVAHDFFAKLGLSDLAIRLNSIGCPSCRPDYHRRLVDYFSTRVDEMCDDCRERYQVNPLRIFDCKNEGCRTILAGAPLSVEHLCPECSTHLDRVKEVLGALGLRHTDDPHLVRGLDYYSRTVFEVTYVPPAARDEQAGVTAESATAAGAQNVLCGGGRYDGLIEELGGPPTPGVGFGLGLERLLARIEADGLEIPAAPVERMPTVFVAAAGDAAEVEAFRLARQLRGAGLTAITDLLGRSLKAQFKAADRAEARFVAVIGEEELAAGTVALKDLARGEQASVARTEVVGVLRV